VWRCSRTQPFNSLIREALEANQDWQSQPRVSRRLEPLGGRARRLSAPKLAAEVAVCMANRCRPTLRGSSRQSDLWGLPSGTRISDFLGRSISGANVRNASAAAAATLLASEDARRGGGNHAHHRRAQAYVDLRTFDVQLDISRALRLAIRADVSIFFVCTAPRGGVPKRSGGEQQG